MGLERGTILRERQEQEKSTKLLVMAASNSTLRNTKTGSQMKPVPPPPPSHLFHHDQHHTFEQQHNQIQNNNNNQISFGMMQSPLPSALIPGNYQLNKDFGELDPSVLHYFTGAQANPSSVQDQRQNSNSATPLMRRSTLNIFPSQPMHTVPTLTNSKGKMESVSLQAGGSKAPSNPPVELTNPKSHAVPVAAFEPPKAPQPLQPDIKNKGSTSSSEQQRGGVRIEDKATRRLVQNREAARKSRQRKKVYIQQLESSRVRLSHLEQEVQRLRAQVIFLGGNAALGGEQGLAVLPMNNSSNSAITAAFDVEYARWLDEHQRRVGELRTAFHDHVPDHELRMFVDNCLTQFDQVMNLKSLLIKADMFYFLTGMWKTPAERSSIWIGGFKPSDIFKVVLAQIEPLTDQQVLAICALQQTTHEAEDSITLGVGNLNQALLESLSSGTLTHTPNMNNYMGHMAIAMTKLSGLETVVRQAETLRHQTIHRLHQILTTRQAARCFMSIAGYFHRMRELSSLWVARTLQE